MKKITASILAIVLFSAFSVRQDKQKIVFFGDSITQAGVNAGGYITRMKEILPHNRPGASKSHRQCTHCRGNDQSFS